MIPARRGAVFHPPGPELAETSSFPGTRPFPGGSLLAASDVVHFTLKFSALGPHRHHFFHLANEVGITEDPVRRFTALVQVQGAFTDVGIEGIQLSVQFTNFQTQLEQLGFLERPMSGLNRSIAELRQAGAKIVTEALKESHHAPFCGRAARGRHRRRVAS